MTERTVSPDPEESLRILVDLWQQVLDESRDAPINPDIDRLVSSRFVSIRYCLPTQLLGKLADSSLDCLCLQKGDLNRSGLAGDRIM